MNAWNPDSVRSDDVGVLRCVLAEKRSPALYDIFGCNAIVAASRILTEVDLNSIGFDWNSGWLFCGRFCAGKK